jgi:hypothetical protein
MPQNKSNEAAQKEIEEAVNRVKEAQQSILTAVIAPEDTGSVIVIILKVVMFV